MSHQIKIKKPPFSTTKTKTSTLSEVVSQKKEVDASFSKYEISEKGWYVFVNSYLGLARIGCQKLQGRLSKENKVIVVSIIYNFKHALEILIKALQKTLKKEKEDIEKTHDIDKLFKELNLKVKKEIKQKKPKEGISKEIKKLERLVKKYRELNFVNEYIKDCFSIEDTENQLFRYPEYSSYIQVDYPKLVNKFTREDIEGIEQDINELINTIKKIRKII